MKNKKKLFTGIALLIAFTIWTILIQSIDVQAVGINGTKIGFAAVNTWFFKLTGAHLTVYTITDWLGLVPICICVFFGIVGLRQFIKRRSIFKIDADNHKRRKCCYKHIGCILKYSIFASTFNLKFQTWHYT